MAQATPLIHLPTPVTTKVGGSADVHTATRAARKFAGAIGFAGPECELLALAASELASNLVRHAGGGLIKLTALQSAGRAGIQVESEDHGPGIANVELAMTDGYSTAGGLGSGLGTVNRVMDDIEFHQRYESGLQILCQRWLRPSNKSLSTLRLECGAATRAYRLAPENGDALLVQQWEDKALLGVIDGLGHGQLAKQAAQAARYYVEEHYDQPLPTLFRGVGRACRSTRGVVMALGRFDLPRQRVAIASIGNIEVRLIDSGNHTHPSVRRGILGLHAPEPLVSELPWNSSSLLIMHSDGLHDRWDWQDFKAFESESPAIIARHLLVKFGKLNDDATVMVARNARV